MYNLPTQVCIVSPHKCHLHGPDVDLCHRRGPEGAAASEHVTDQLLGFAAVGDHARGEVSGQPSEVSEGEAFGRREDPAWGNITTLFHTLLTTVSPHNTLPTLLTNVPLTDNLTMRQSQ